MSGDNKIQPNARKAEDCCVMASPSKLDWSWIFNCPLNGDLYTIGCDSSCVAKGTYMWFLEYSVIAYLEKEKFFLSEIVAKKIWQHQNEN